jgi:hypothetical protein
VCLAGVDRSPELQKKKKDKKNNDYWHKFKLSSLKNLPVL